MSTSYLSLYDLTTAKRHLQGEWAQMLQRHRRRPPSHTDSYTDGFWDGRLWAAARVLKALGDDPGLRSLVLESLEIEANEAARHSV
jgi:hypothetical protein